MCYRRASASRPRCKPVFVPRAASPRPADALQRQRGSGSRLAVLCRTVAACLVTLAVAGGCGSNATPASPSDIYQGFWTGTITDSTGGAGTLNISLTGGSPLNGTWSANLPAASPIGFITSEPVTTAQRSLALACGTSGSVGLNATVTGKTMTGTYLALGCGLSTGSVNLVRR